MNLQVAYTKGKTFSKRMLTTRFFREGTILQVGSFLNTGIATVSSVALVRLLGANEYGRYAIVIACINLVVWVTDPGLDTTALTCVAPVMAAVDRERILDALATYVRASIFFLIVLGFAIFPFIPPFMRSYFHAPSLVLPVWLWIIGNMLQLGSRFIILLLQSMRLTRSLVWFEFFTGIISNAFRIAFVFTGLGVLGLAAGYVVGGVGTCLLAAGWYRRLRLREYPVPSVSALLQRSRMVSMKDFVKQSFLVVFDRRLSGLPATLLVVFLGRYASAREVGYYGLAFGVATTAFLLMSGFSRLMQIQFPRSLAAGYASLRKHYLMTSLGTGGLSFLFLVGTALLSPWVVPLVYGAEFSPVVSIVWVCVLALVPVGFTMGNSATYRLLPKGLTVSIGLTILQVVVGVVLLLVGHFFLQPITTVLMVLMVWGWIGVPTHFLVIYRMLSKSVLQEKASAV